MEYVFTDWDNRSYKRKSKEKISIEAEHIFSEQVELSLKESGKGFVELMEDI
jgi:hypothetical protein